MIRDQRGAAYVETLIAVPVLLWSFACLFAFGHLMAAQLMVQRAASAGVRAAVVFGPDDPIYYSTCPSGAKCVDYRDKDGLASADACVKRAVARVLDSGIHFLLDDASLTVEWKKAKEWDPVTLKVSALYDCKPFLWGAVICGPDRIATISDQATLNYQQGLTRSQKGH